MRNLIFISLLLFVSSGYTSDIGVETGLIIPRYVSLKSDESNLRIGPSKNYPIVLIYNVANFPIKIVDEYQDWRKIIDFESNSGWVHKSLIKAERYGIIKNQNYKTVKIYNSIENKIIGEIDRGSIVLISKCKIDKCKIIKSNYSGWIKKEDIWGVDKEEKFNVNFFQTAEDYINKTIQYIEKIVFKKNLKN